MKRTLSAAALLACGLLGCTRGGCVSVLVAAPLLRDPHPTDMKYDPALPPNDTLLMVAPGEYEYKSQSAAKSWTALRLQVGQADGYIIREDGVTAACKDR